MPYMPAGTLLIYEAFCTMLIDCCGGKFRIFGEVSLSGSISFCDKTLKQFYHRILNN